MRDYGKVSPQFWIGRTGKSLRGNPEAQVLALYLMTSPHANMIGVYHCPIVYMSHETGLTIEGASKALQSLIEADFCTFDADDEYVFVHQFALHQVGESLALSDNRSKGVANELSKVPKNQCWQAFRARYAHAYNLPNATEKGKPHASPLEAPSKPEAGAEAEAEDVAPKKALHIPGVPEQLLRYYIELRKGKRAGKLTPTAIRGLEREAGLAGISLAEAIEACCEFGWQGFNAEWYAQRRKGRPAGDDPYGLRTAL